MAYIVAEIIDGKGQYSFPAYIIRGTLYGDDDVPLVNQKVIMQVVDSNGGIFLETPLGTGSTITSPNLSAGFQTSKYPDGTYTIKLKYGESYEVVIGTITIKKGVMISFTNTSAPTPTPTPAPTPTPTSIPILESCTIPTFSYNFYVMISGLISYLACNIRNMILQLEWIVSTLASLVPQILAFLVYVLSLQWLKDFIFQFFAQLDIWISNKFGIDPALPFWEELIKKALTWIGLSLDTSAENRMRERKW